MGFHGRGFRRVLWGARESVFLLSSHMPEQSVAHRSGKTPLAVGAAFLLLFLQWGALLGVLFGVQSNEVFGSHSHASIARCVSAFMVTL